MTVERIVADFLPLTTEDVLAVPAYAADRERKIATAPR
jgi:hypothetical protein